MNSEMKDCKMLGQNHVKVPTLPKSAFLGKFARISFCLPITSNRFYKVSKKPLAEYGLQKLCTQIRLKLSIYPKSLFALFSNY